MWALISRILGLGREFVLAYALGAGPVADAFHAAFRLPGLLRNLIAEGAFGTRLSIEVADVAANGKAQDVRDCIRSRSAVVLPLSLLLSVILVLGATWVVRILVPEFANDPERLGNATRFLRGFGFYLLPLGSAAFCAAVLVGLGVSGAPSALNSLFNLVSSVLMMTLVVLGVLSGREVSLENLAFGFVVATFIAGVVQAIAGGVSLQRRLRKVSDGVGKWAPSRSPGLGMASFASQSVIQILGLALIGAAASLGTGEVTRFSLAFRLLQFPLGLFGASVALGATSVLGGMERESRDQLAADSLRAAFFLNMLCAIGLAVLAEPILKLLFGYGRFLPEDVTGAAAVLAAAAFSVPFYATSRIGFVLLEAEQAPVRWVSHFFIPLAGGILGGWVGVKFLGAAGLGVALVIGSGFQAVLVFRSLPRFSYGNPRVWARSVAYFAAITAYLLGVKIGWNRLLEIYPGSYALPLEVLHRAVPVLAGMLGVYLSLPGWMKANFRVRPE